MPPGAPLSCTMCRRCSWGPQCPCRARWPLCPAGSRSAGQGGRHFNFKEGKDQWGQSQPQGGLALSGALDVPVGQGGRPALLGAGQEGKHFEEGEDQWGQPQCQGVMDLMWSHIHNQFESPQNTFLIKTLSVLVTLMSVEKTSSSLPPCLVYTGRQQSCVNPLIFIWSHLEELCEQVTKNNILEWSQCKVSHQ